METFYLGSHEPSWLGRSPYPLCVARQRLWRNTRRVPEARSGWMLDSGAYQMLERNGRWTYTPQQYADFVRKCVELIGNLDWAAPMDHMCEPHIRAKTGLTTREHQHRTVGNFLDLLSIDATLPIWPVLQGWEPWEYEYCADLYERAGVRLEQCAAVGLGGVCRLQHTDKAQAVLDRLAGRRLRLHGFGFKMTGLVKHGHRFATADSMAWSYNARKNPPLPECAHARCNNCYTRALWWRERLLSKMQAQEIT